MGEDVEGFKPAVFFCEVTFLGVDGTERARLWRGWIEISGEGDLREDLRGLPSGRMKDDVRPLYSCLNIIEAVNTRLSLNSEYNVSLNVYQPRASLLLSDVGSKRPLIFPTDVEELPTVA